MPSSGCENATALVLPPEGYDVDFCHPARRADISTYWCFGIGLVLAILFTAQRLYVKLKLGSGWQIDDTLLALAWVTGLATQICIVYGFASGAMGVHIWEISASKYNGYRLNMYVWTPIYTFAGSCAKIALSLFYLRLSPQRWFRYANFATMGFIATYSIGIFFSLIFGCTPIRKGYDASVQGGHCIDTAEVYIAIAFFNIVSDLLLFVLPIPMIIGLQMKWKVKMGVLFIFGIGSATVVTSIMRAAILVPLIKSKDPPWHVAPASMLTVVEANLIIICSMLPTLRKFFLHVAPKLAGESGSESGGGAAAAAVHGHHHKRKSSDAPAIVTFGSPSSPSRRAGGGRGRHRGFARFDELMYTLQTIGSTHRDVGPLDPKDSKSSQMSAEDGVVNVSRKKSRKDTINMAVMAGESSVHNETAAENNNSSPDSSVPTREGTGTKPSGITTTTRIEVSYDTATKML